MASPNKWAIIIGIDVYFRRTGSKRNTLANLDGCVADAENTYEYLQRSPFNIPTDNMTLLTSSHKDFPSGNKANMWELPLKESKLGLNLATYENIMKSLKKVLESSQPGDHVYFHYSGHGGRVPTHKELHHWPGKNTNKVDEVLFPADCDVDKGNYRGLLIRDWELAFVFGAMVEKGLQLTVVIDSCSSGGTIRAPDLIDANVETIEVDSTTITRIRGIQGLADEFGPQDKDIRPLFSPMENIEIAWRKLQAQSTVRKAWLLQPFQYNIITACLAHEQSHELLKEGVLPTKEGVLSKGIIDSLKEIHELGKPVTYQMLFRNVYDRCYGRTYNKEDPRDVQTPVMLGDPDKVFFGPDDRTLKHIASIPVHALPELKYSEENVIPIDRKDPKLILRAGRAHGVKKGEIYGIYEWTASAEDMRDPARAIGQLAVVEVKEVVSVLGLIKDAKLSTDPWKTGRQAILLHGPAGETGVIQIRLFGSTAFPKLQSMLAKVQPQYFKGPVPLAFSANPPTTDYQIAEEDGKFWLRDAGGKRIPNVPGCNPDQLVSMLKYLTHVCQYKRRRDIEDSESIEYNIKMSGVINSEGKDEITLKFENIDSATTVNFAVYHFTPNWGIHKIYPLDGDFESIDPNDTRTFSLQRDPIKGDIPEDMDFVKVLITNGSISFSTWELPDIPLDGSMEVEPVHEDAMLKSFSSSPGKDAEVVLYTHPDFDVTEEELEESQEAKDHNSTKLNKYWSKRLDISTPQEVACPVVEDILAGSR